MKVVNTSLHKANSIAKKGHLPTTITFKQMTDLRSIFCHSLKVVIMYGEGNVPIEHQGEYHRFVDTAYGLAEQAKLFGIKLSKNEIGPYLQQAFDEKAEKKQKFKSKSALIHDYARTTPMVALHEVFDRTSTYSLTVETTDWLTSALTNAEGNYADADSRFYLMWFYEWLQVTCFAMYCIFIQSTLKSRESNPHIEKLIYEYENYCNNKNIQPESFQDPVAIVRSLCAEFDVSHARTELWEWLEAGLSNSRFYTKKAEISNLLYSYQSILAVIESAYCLIQ